MNASAQAAIGLGANLGDRGETIALAIERINELEHTEIQRVSALRETAPVGVVDQATFLNGCCLIRTALDARVLLRGLHRIERELGRERTREQRWGPRTIDLDLLLFEDHVIDADSITVPHPRMHERRFVLDPLREIAPEMEHPVLGVTIRVLHARLVGSDRVQDANLLA